MECLDVVTLGINAVVLMTSISDSILIILMQLCLRSQGNKCKTYSVKYFDSTRNGFLVPFNLVHVDH